MMTMLRALIAALAIASPALAQSPPYPPSMPPRTVVGNMTTVTNTGRAITIAQLQAAMLSGETPIADANYSIPVSDSTCAGRTFAYTSLTASRTVTLGSASCYTPGTQLFVFDRSGNATSTKTISVAPTGADLINGANVTTSIINAPYVIVALESDGVSKWTASAALSTTLAPFFAVANPSSGNFIGCGNPTSHQLVWSDCNPQFNADTMQFFSTDPSADGIITFGGTPVAGDIYTLNFIYNSTTVSVFYTVQGGDTTTTVAQQLACAIAANTTLFRLNGGSCSGGVVTAAANQSFGGYGSGNLVGWVSGASGQIEFDYNGATSLQMSYTVSGAHTETVTFTGGFYHGTQYTGGTAGGTANALTVAATGFTRATGATFTFTASANNTTSTTINVQSTGAVTVKKQTSNGLVNLAGGEIVSGTTYTAVDNGTNYVLNMNSAVVNGGSSQSTAYQMPNALDGNPSKNDSRNVAFVLPTASVITNWAATGPTASCIGLTVPRCVTYGQISHYVGNSVVGNLQSAWLLAAQGGNSSFANGGGGVWIGQGVYSNYTGSPFGSTALADMGPGTFNAGTCFYINYTNSAAGDSLCQSTGAGQLILTTTTDAIVLSSAAGVGINGAPSGVTFTSGLGAFVTGSQVPTSGTGVSIAYSGGGIITAENYGTSAFQILSLVGSQVNISPSATLANGVTVQANAFIPGGDNVTQSGSSLNRWTGMHTLTSVLYGATSGNLTVKCAAVCGTNTLTLPAGTTDFSSTGGANRVLKQTSAGGAITVAALVSADLPQPWNAISSGTSGGIPYFNSTTSVASSALLGATGIVVGGGAGAAPSSSSIWTISGTTLAGTSSSNSSPTFQFMNSAADASSALMLYDKTRSGGDSNSGDTIGFLVFRGHANSSMQNSAAVKVTQSGASSGSNIPTQVSLQTSNTAGLLNQNLNFDTNAHLSAVQATAPSLTAGCNGAGSSVTGTDLQGTATGQTSAATTCTLTFGTAFAAAPNCSVTGLSSPLTGAVTPGTTTLVVNFGSTGNYKFSWICMGA